MTARPSPEQIAEAAATVRDTLSWTHTHPLLSMDFQREADAALDVLVAAAQQADEAKNLLLEGRELVVLLNEERVAAAQQTDALEEALRKIDRDHHETYVDGGEHLDDCPGCVARAALAPEERVCMVCGKGPVTVSVCDRCCE